MVNIGKGLNKISDIYQEKAEQIIKETRQVVLVSVLILLAIGLGASLASVILGRRMAARISKTILAVTNWSEQLSAGVDNLRRIKQIEERIGSMDDASARQQELMNRINEEIGRISNAVTEKADDKEFIELAARNFYAYAQKRD